MSKENDRALRFYNQVLGLDHLHYGLWDKEEDLTLANMRLAQQRYEDFLVGHVPESVQSLLDVGCGTSALSRRLLEKGLDVEGLSPEASQMENFRSHLNAPFHHCRFEQFTPTRRYDCLIMSESCQYIPMDRLFAQVERCLKPEGHLLIFDYFVLDSAQGRLAKSGHNYSGFLQAAESRNWIKQEETDITESAARTLDLAEDFAQRSLVAAEILSEKFRSRRPRLTKFLFWLGRKKWQKIEEQRVLIDSEAFCAHKKYVFLHYCISGSVEDAAQP